MRHNSVEKTVSLLRLPTVKQLTGLSRSSVYLYIKNGMFPSPVKIGGARSAWVSTEIEALNNARISGKSDEYIRQLVTNLHNARSSAGGIESPINNPLQRHAESLKTLDKMGQS